MISPVLMNSAQYTPGTNISDILTATGGVTLAGVSIAGDTAIMRYKTLAAGNVLSLMTTTDYSPAGLSRSAAEIGQALRKDIQNRLTVSAELSPWSFETASGPGASPARTIAALVGPPGVGKTTMVAKLAMRFGISARRATHIISYDGHGSLPATNYDPTQPSWALVSKR